MAEVCEVSGGVRETPRRAAAEERAWREVSAAATVAACGPRADSVWLIVVARLPPAACQAVQRQCRSLAAQGQGRRSCSGFLRQAACVTS